MANINRGGSTMSHLDIPCARNSKTIKHKLTSLHKPHTCMFFPLWRHKGLIFATTYLKWSKQLFYSNVVISMLTWFVSRGHNFCLRVILLKAQRDDLTQLSHGANVVHLMLLFLDDPLYIDESRGITKRLHCRLKMQAASSVKMHILSLHVD